MCFSLAAFKILSLSLIFGILIMMYLGVALFASTLFGTFCASWICMSISFTKEVCFHYFFQISFQFPALSLLLWHPYYLNVGMFEVVPEAPYPILVFLSFLFFSFFFLILLSSCCSDFFVFNLCFKSLIWFLASSAPLLMPVYCSLFQLV